MRQSKSGLWPAVYKVICEAKGMSLLLLLLIGGAVASSLIPPLVLERVINRLTGGQEVALSLALIYFAFLAISGLLEAGQNVMITVFGQKIIHGLRSQMCEKLHKLPASYYTKNEPGKITSRFVSDVDTVEALFTDGIISMFANICKVVCILGVIFVKSPGLGILMLIVTPLLFVMTRVFQKRMLTAQIKNRAAVEKVNNHVPETIRNIRMIHTLFRENYMEERYDNYIEESYRAQEKSNIYDSIYSPIVIFISSVVIAVMMVGSAASGGMQEFFGMSVGAAVAVIAYVGKVFDPLESIGMEIQNIQSAVAGTKRVNEFLQQEERPLKVVPLSKEQMIKATEDMVNLEQVTFGYEKDEPVVRDLSLTVKRGENVTLAGRTGAGKSTIFRLLLGLYVPWQGEIQICGVPAYQLAEQDKRQLFGYVEQNFHLVKGTVAEQISLFDSEISREQIEQAAKLVGLHEEILALEKGYDTPATADLFSQGQFQLLSIARAVVANPQIMLLDEITANLDTDTEEHILNALNRASQERTVLSISHRLYERNGAGRVIYCGK